MRFTQIWVYARKFYRTQQRDSIISIILGVVIAGVVVWITGDKMFDTYEDTKFGFFSIVSACIWIGIFNSIQLVCREKNDIVKDELDKGLHATSYIAAHFAFQFALCFVQSIIIMIICWIKIDFPTDGVVFGFSFFDYFVTVFLIIYASDALALVISSAVSTPVVAMTIMPLVLIIQLVLSGVLFKLGSAANKIASFTISKWGMAAMGSVADLNSHDLESTITKRFPEFPFPFRSFEGIYKSTPGHLWIVWLILFSFIAVSYGLSVGALKYTTRKISK